MHETITLLAGPILRRTTPSEVVFWWVTDAPAEPSLNLIPLTPDSNTAIAVDCTLAHQQMQAGDSLYIHLLKVTPARELPTDKEIEYDLRLNGLGWNHWAEDLVYPGHKKPFFVIKPKLSHILHGSCRKPHHDSGDGLVRVDTLLASTPTEEWPSLLIMNGDQIYADDVAGPMLWAIHHLIPHLGMPDETLPCVDVKQASRLHNDTPCYYYRESLLPNTEASQKMLSQVFGGARKPVFTSASAHNHLISIAEVLAMYLLVWSPEGWKKLNNDTQKALPNGLSATEEEQFRRERRVLEGFIRSLPQIRRAMAHLPVAMIFDDHDVTDDWNLTAEWEQTAYGHPFSARIIGNALLGYLLCQGWGNAPEHFSDELMDRVQHALEKPGSEQHDHLLQELLAFSQWHYLWPTSPTLLVLDTRTHRWRSEESLAKPSGLMDWEALTDLQQQLMNLDAVVLVSPAPIFGVKLIENIQRVFTWFGKPLLVDAENWMAHPGSASTLLNMFRHAKTPKHFIILSGDVHYSFVYKVQLRGINSRPDVWQITSSGIKNEFPKRLLDVFDRLNRWLYSPKSPLNWFTRRRRMRVIPHKPDHADKGERLLNASGIGLVSLNDDGSPKAVTQLCADGRDVYFKLSESDARWD
ncbi:alkaline phosphatase D family protein [Nitrincola iocasae]|uniref:Alkaline phosphatase family protein n=1 Tax=Nitrincola iocasae TaxID=2614693 RepID=A0A5J6LI86_9GAMM|nr:alkaline phosphatase D family protein [Nitrincola iocasae]QEW08022.1 alkaline phosphatase family protein [Nitrincola iocasae]